MFSRIRNVRMAGFLAMAAVGMMATPIASAATTTQAGSYSGKEEMTVASPDPAGGTATALAHAQPSTGQVTGSVTVESVPPAGVTIPLFLPGGLPSGVQVGASYAISAPRVIHAFPVVTGTVTATASVNVTSSYYHTTYKPIILPARCICDVHENGYALSRLQIELWYYPCAIGGGCAPTKRKHVINGGSANYGSVTAGTYTLTNGFGNEIINTGGAAHVKVRIGPMLEALSKGAHKSTASMEVIVNSMSVTN